MKAVLGFLAGLLISLNVLADATVVTQQAFLEWQKSDKKFLLLDTRSPEEFAAGHIQGAVNIEFNRIAENMDKLIAHKDKVIVVYCRSGRRAGIAERYLEEQGFNGLHHLQGDILGWNKAGLPLVK